jgi:hypothetical protein
MVECFCPTHPPLLQPGSRGGDAMGRHPVVVWPLCPWGWEWPVLRQCPGRALWARLYALFGGALGELGEIWRPLQMSEGRVPCGLPSLPWQWGEWPKDPERGSGCAPLLGSGVCSL